MQFVHRCLLPVKQLTTTTAICQAIFVLCSVAFFARYLESNLPLLVVLDYSCGVNDAGHCLSRVGPRAVSKWVSV